MANSEYAFIAMIPFQIEADWDEYWGPLLAGFPHNIKYVTKESQYSPVKWSFYEPDLAAFLQGATYRELVYRNTKGGAYIVRVVLHNDGKLEVYKHNGEKIVGSTSGRATTEEEFDLAMTHATVIGVQKDEPSTCTQFHDLPLN
jgi:hypothetical protein